VAFVAALVGRTEMWKTFVASVEGEVDYGKDYAVAVAVAFLFPLVRYALDRTAYTVMANLVVVPSERKKQLKARSKRNYSEVLKSPPPVLRKRKKVGGVPAAADSEDLTQEEQEAVDVRVEKFKESCWKASVYFFFSAYGFVFMRTKPWFYDRGHFWHGFHDDGPNCQWDHSCPSLCTTDDWPGCSTCKFTFDVKLYYILELGYYLQAIFSLVFWETRRKDFAVMMGHHIVTIILIVFSHWGRLLRIGTMVFLLHDVSDVPLELAKASRYANFDRLTDVFFAFFFLVWILSRIVYFPLVIIRTALYEVPKCPRIEWKREYCMVAFDGLLLSLFAIHVYWTFLIGRILHRAVVGGKVNDEREDDT